MARNISLSTFYLKGPLFFFVGRFAGRVDAGLGMAGGDKRRCDVDTESWIDHRVLGVFQLLLGLGDIDLRALFGLVAEHSDDIIFYLQETAGNREAISMI